MRAAVRTLAAGQSIEFLTTLSATGTTSISLTGNAFAQQIEGNAGTNTLDGGGGADTMVGFAGSDTYKVDNAGDVIVEAAGEGSDSVLSTVSYTLAAGQSIETFSAADAAATTAINLSGNELAQRINGNAGDNILDGGAGNDTLYGLGGNDTYRVDAAGDEVNESAGQGFDTVIASASYVLKFGSEVELVKTSNALATTAIDLTGNSTAQRIEGNAGVNILTGASGADTLFGGGASDTLDLGSGTDKDVVLYTSVGESTGAARDVVLNLDLNGEDRIDLASIPTSVQSNVTVGNLSTATFDADLAAAIGAGQLSANGAVLFDPNGGDLNVAGHLFLVIDANGVAGYQAGADYVVEVVNMNGALDLTDFF